MNLLPGYQRDTSLPELSVNTPLTPLGILLSFHTTIKSVEILFYSAEKSPGAVSGAKVNSFRSNSAAPQHANSSDIYSKLGAHKAGDTPRQQGRGLGGEISSLAHPPIYHRQTAVLNEKQHPVL